MRVGMCMWRQAGQGGLGRWSVNGGGVAGPTWPIVLVRVGLWVRQGQVRPCPQRVRLLAALGYQRSGTVGGLRGGDGLRRGRLGADGLWSEGRAMRHAGGRRVWQGFGPFSGLAKRAAAPQTSSGRTSTPPPTHPPRAHATCASPCLAAPASCPPVATRRDLQASFCQGASRVCKTVGGGFRGSVYGAVTMMVRFGVWCVVSAWRWWAPQRRLGTQATASGKGKAGAAGVGSPKVNRFGR